MKCNVVRANAFQIHGNVMAQRIAMMVLMKVTQCVQTTIVQIIISNVTLAGMLVLLLFILYILS